MRKHVARWMKVGSCIYLFIIGLVSMSSIYDCILCIEALNYFQVLDGQKVLPAKAKELGFPFKYRYVKDALKAILS